MRKIIVLEHISLDGVIQAPGGQEEDTSDGFAYGGWSNAYSDPVLGTLLRTKMNTPFDLLLGRKRALDRKKCARDTGKKNRRKICGFLHSLQRYITHANDGGIPLTNTTQLTTRGRCLTRGRYVDPL